MRPDGRLTEATEAPCLETDRLVLRGHRVEDFPLCAEMWRDPVVIRYTVGSEPPPQRTWQRLLAYCGHWRLLGFGYWAVESKATGQYIGELGFADFQRGIAAIAGVPELGWALAVGSHGRGYATEALRKVVEWGDAHLGVGHTVCIIHRDNTNSIRVARKIGYGTTLRAATDEQPDMLLARDSHPTKDGSR